MNLLARAIAPNSEAPNPATSGRTGKTHRSRSDRTKGPPRVRFLSPHSETRRANLHDLSTAQPKTRRGSTSVRTSDAERFSG